jgi:uncharacterized protein
MTSQLTPPDESKSDESKSDELQPSEFSQPTPASATDINGADEALKAEPVRPSQRVVAVDVLRGVALLGILAMNIVFFAWPMGGYENPHWSGGRSLANDAHWTLNTLLFSGKMMSLFSMLFGAGLVLMCQRADQRGARTAGVYYRRIFWLLCIGMVHAYLVWSGDILVMYAVCGIALYWFRNFSARTLVVMGVLLLLIQSAIQHGFTEYGQWARGISQRVEANEAAGVASEDWELGVHQGWKEGMRGFLSPTQEDFDKEIAVYRGGYLEIVAHRAPEVMFFHLFGFFLFGLGGVGGRMLLGMALMKLGVFSAQRSTMFYRNLLIVGYGLGLLCTVPPVIVLLRDDFDTLQSPWATTLLATGMVPMALGHTALVMLIFQSGIWRGMLDRLAAVGRMALTNYLTQSLICTTLFYGYGIGLFGTIDRWALWFFVLAIWALQLVYSPWWMSRFRYGPAEWVWRRLTYLDIKKTPALAASGSNATVD